MWSASAGTLAKAILAKAHGSIRREHSWHHRCVLQTFLRSVSTADSLGAELVTKCCRSIGPVARLGAGRPPQAVAAFHRPRAAHAASTRSPYPPLDDETMGDNAAAGAWYWSWARWDKSRPRFATSWRCSKAASARCGKRSRVSARGSRELIGLRGDDPSSDSDPLGGRPPREAPRQCEHQCVAPWRADLGHWCRHHHHQQSAPWRPLG